MLFLFLGVLGIGIRLNIAKENLILGALGGVIAMIAFNFASAFFPEPANVFITAFAASVYSEIMARIRKTPVTVFLPLAITPILPGKAVYDAISLAMNRNTDQFIQNGISIFYTTMSIALGIIAVRTIDVIFSGLVHRFFCTFTKR